MARYSIYSGVIADRTHSSQGNIPSDGARLRRSVGDILATARHHFPAPKHSSHDPATARHLHPALRRSNIRTIGDVNRSRAQPSPEPLWRH
jgi:hypothetical protein